MTPRELRILHNLLDKFISLEHEGSLYGRKMDQALAKSIQVALCAYGITWEAELTLYDGTKHTVTNYDKDTLIRCCDYFIKNKNIPTHTGYDSQPVSYRILP